MNQIDLIQQRLAVADGLPAVLTASWEIFGLIATSASASADRSACENAASEAERIAWLLAKGN